MSGPDPIEPIELREGETLVASIRHGLTVLNRDRLVGGRTDVPLLEEGREQARVAARAAANLPFDVVVTSPLRRAMETARLVTGRDPGTFQIDELCTERSFGEMEGIDPADVPARFPQVEYLSVGGIRYSLNPPGGEKFDALHARATRFLEGIIAAHTGRRVAVFSHQNFIQQLHAVLRGMDRFEALEHDVLNCELNEFLLAPDRSVLAHRTVRLAPSAAEHASF